MQHKQRFTNVTLVTPSGEEDKDLLIEGDKIAQIINRNENLSDDWKIIDGHNNYILSKPSVYLSKKSLSLKFST